MFFFPPNRRYFQQKLIFLRQGQCWSKNYLQSVQCQPVLFHLYAVCYLRQSFVRGVSLSKQEPSAILPHFVPPSYVEDIPGRKTPHRKNRRWFYKETVVVQLYCNSWWWQITVLLVDRLDLWWAEWYSANRSVRGRASHTTTLCTVSLTSTDPGANTDLHRE